MSAGYASRLSAYPNKGVCGLPESRDTKRAYTVKIDALVAAIKESSRIVIFTGAGISTAAGIPDFRGPNGTLLPCSFCVVPSLYLAHLLTHTSCD